MAESLTLRVGARFPAGSTVDIYPASARSGDQINPGPPRGTPVATGLVVAADGTLVISGLERNTRYLVYGQVNGVDRYVGFGTMHEEHPVVASDDGKLFASGHELTVIGAPGPPGPPGQAAVAISDALRGADGRYYRETGVDLVYNGSAFVADASPTSRAQNIDNVVSDAAKIRVTHSAIGALHVVGSPIVTVADPLDSVGIRAIPTLSSDLTYTDIVLRQTRSLDDSISYNGSAWVKEGGTLSPFTVTFASNVLQVTHSSLGSTKASEIRLTGQGLLRPVLVPGSVTATGFNIAFYNAAGTQVTSASTDMAVGISRNIKDRAIDPTSLTVDALISKQQSWATYVPSLNPIFWARLGEASGTSFADQIGTNTGVSQATVTLGAGGAVSGDSDTAITLDGVQGKVAFASPGIPTTSGWSLSIWAKMTGAGTVGGTTYGTIIGWSSGSTRRIMWHVASNYLYVDIGGGFVLQSANGSLTQNVWNHIVVVWDGIHLTAYINGVQVAQNSGTSVLFNSGFWLGSYLGTSTNYSFKGSLDEPIIWNRPLTLPEVQQLYVTGADAVVSVNKASDSRIGFRALFETSAPAPDQPPDVEVPVPTPLPAGDVGGGGSTYISLAQYRTDGTLKFGPSHPWCHRALPTLQADRDAIALNGLSGLPAATSDNWRIHLCNMIGIDPTTGAVVPAQQGGNTPLWMRAAGEWIYVVPDDEPRRTITDLDVSVSGWAPAFMAAQTTLGGCPIPADAMPHFTADRYAFIFQPSRQEWWTLYAFGPSDDHRAITTLDLSSAPTGGGFFMEFDYTDNMNQTTQTFFCQSPILYNSTATQVRDAIFGAKTSAGTAIGSTRSAYPTVEVSGGPLNQAPIVIRWKFEWGLHPVATRVTSNFLNAGYPVITHQNADEWDTGRLCAVTSPSLGSNHAPTLTGSNGGTAAATGIDWLPMVIDWDEYGTAYNIGIASGWDAPGTDLGHVVPVSIGNAGTGAVYPALRGDGTLANTDGSKIKEGALVTFRTDADASRINPTYMPLFNTCKRYGFIPIDKTGGGMEFIFRNWRWPGENRAFPGPPAFNFSTYIAELQKFPWHQTQIIDPAHVLSGW